MSINKLGGKGYQLTQLAKICEVPPFFVISGKESDKEILAEFDKHGFDLVSVRSSATVEDGVNASFAGMFETKLNVVREGLIDAIKEVLNSVNSSRVHEYCRLNNIDAKTVEMRIIVQKMVNSRISGVAITRESRESDSMIIEVCHGLGEYLVGGLVTPDTFITCRNTLKVKSKNIGYQGKMLTRDGEKNVPFFLRNCAKITDDELTELAKTCLMIEKKMKYKSADIEWAFEGDKLYILQSRPFVAL